MQYTERFQARDGLLEPAVKSGSREDDFYIQNFGRTNRCYIVRASELLPSRQTTGRSFADKEGARQETAGDILVALEATP
jgi:hypothetical protein